MKHKQLSLFGLKFNPFTSEVPVSSLWRNQKIENFCFEAQESSTTLLNELRLLSSCDLDSRNMLSVILAGDSRLTDKLHTTDLLPLASRIRIKLAMQKSSHQELMTCLEHLLEQAGSPSLMSKGLKNSICEHAMGNYRTLMNMGHELLNQAILQEKEQIDEKLFLETFNPTPNKT